MKTIFIFTLATLSACSLFQPKPDGEVPGPVVREEFFECPAYEKCAGRFKSGGICEPSGEHHSVAEKCDVVK